MIQKEIPQNDQWSDEYGYDPMPEIERLGNDPDSFSVDSSVVTEEDRYLLENISESVSEVLMSFDFSRFEQYLEDTELEDWLPLHKLVLLDILPAEILAIRLAFLEFSQLYSSHIFLDQKIENGVNTSEKDKAFLLLSLSIIHKILFDVSDEGFYSQMIEDDVPPCLIDLSAMLEQLEALFALRFSGEQSTLALEFAEDKRKYFSEYVLEEKAELATLPESTQEKRLLRETIENYQRIENGFAAIIQALQA